MEPTPTKTWNITPNNRIPFVTLLDCQQNYLLGVKNAMKAAGMNVKGSCSAGTGAMDAADRWNSSGDVTPRATSAGASQAWIVVTMANGVDVLIAFQGASDDIARVSFSPGGLYVAASTPSNQPTATDEVILMQAVSLIGATASGDRVWHALITADAKQMRFLVSRGGVFVGERWSVEEFTPTVDASVNLSPAVCGIALTNTAPLGTTTTVGQARSIIGGIARGMTCIFGVETFATATNWSNTKTGLQGGSSYPAFPLKIGSSLAGAEGPLGELIDAWLGRTGAGEGDTYDSKKWIGVSGLVGANGGMMWPWDGTTTPAMT